MRLGVLGVVLSFGSITKKKGRARRSPRLFIYLFSLFFRHRPFLARELIRPSERGQPAVWDNRPQNLGFNTAFCARWFRYIVPFVRVACEKLFFA